LAVVVVVVGAIAYFETRPQSEKMMYEGEKMMDEGTEMVEEGEVMVKEGEKMMDEGEAMTEGENMAMADSYEGELLAGDKNPLLSFTKTDYEKAIASDKLVIIYFYANWCPICRAEFPKMESAFDKLTTDNVIGFRVNFNDNETDADEKALASEFGVAYQHTKVILKNGERILKSPESWDEARYLTEINKALGN